MYSIALSQDVNLSDVKAGGVTLLQIDRSIEPDAMCWPDGSNLAAKTSPEWPETGKRVNGS